MTDPAAALGRKSGLPRFAYSLNATVDTALGIVLDLKAVPERFAGEALAARRMIERLGGARLRAGRGDSRQGLRVGAVPRLA